MSTKKPPDPLDPVLQPPGEGIADSVYEAIGMLLRGLLYHEHSGGRTPEHLAGQVRRSIAILSPAIAAEIEQDGAARVYEERWEEVAELSPEEREEYRIENATSPLFDMWLRFEDVFGDRAIDRLDVSDEDAEAAAKTMEASGTESGRAFAYLLRSIANRRRLREISHKVSAVWAASGTSESMSIPEIHERYAKLPKGDA